MIYCMYVHIYCLNTYVRTYMYVHMLTCVVVHMLSVCSCSVIPAEDYLVAFHNRNKVIYVDQLVVSTTYVYLFMYYRMYSYVSHTYICTCAWV